MGRWVVYISSIYGCGWEGRSTTCLPPLNLRGGTLNEPGIGNNLPLAFFFFFSCAILLSLASYGIDFAIECMSSVCTYVRSLRDESICTFVVVVKFHMNDFKMWQYYSSTSSSFVLHSGSIFCGFWSQISMIFGFKSFT